MALLEGAEYCMLLKALIKEITSFDIHLVCISDNKSLVDAMQSTSVIEDKRLYIDICALREITKVKLTSSKKQIADCLTKGTASSDNLKGILCGRDSIDID